jgi:hypothetical protein
LECPVCGGHTVQRDVSLEDGYYVEWCQDGTIRERRVNDKGEETDEFEEFECPYFDAGFEGK